jgi:hypothetical protein
LESLYASSPNVINMYPVGKGFLVPSDNRGIVEGWWTGRSRNDQVNEVPKRIHSLIGIHQCSIFTKYVLSAFNPADGPSRGIFPELQHLPPIELPPELKSIIFPFDHPEHGFCRRHNDGKHIHPTLKQSTSLLEDENDLFSVSALESQTWELFETENAWERL